MGRKIQSADTIQSHATFGRRALLKSAATLATGAGGAVLLPEVAVEARAATKSNLPVAAPIIVASDSSGIADTTSGKVRGYTRNGVYAFKGIPYAAPTGGNARFMPPVKPKPWTGVRSSMYYGQVCPQAPRGGWAVDENAF